MDNIDNKISLFWQVFLTHSAGLLRARSANDPAYDQVLRALHVINEDLYVEFTSDNTRGELIITAGGVHELFQLVDAIVDAAPPTPSWLVRALRPKIGFPKKTVWEGLKISIDDVYFKPFTYEQSRAVLIEIHVRGLKESDLDRAHNAVLIAIDHGLGERAFAEQIQETRIEPFSGKANPPDTHPITDLESFLDWHEGQEAAR